MKIPVIKTNGDSYNLGYQHGRQAKESIKNNFQFYLNKWQYFSSVGRDKVINDVKQFIPYIKTANPELLEELEGIAVGAQMQFEEILALNTRFELNFIYASKNQKNIPTDGCTSFALTPEVTKDSQTYIGQNIDINPGLELIVLKISQENNPDIIINTEAGMIGKMGFNSEGIGVCLNYLRCENDIFKLKPGLPIVMKIRNILNSDNFGDCMKAIMSSEGTISMNILLAHREGEAINVECTPQDQFFLYPNCGILTHSNHFLSPSLRVRDTGKGLLPDTVIRSERAFRLLRNRIGNLHFDTITDVMKDHFAYPGSICRHKDKRLAQHEQWETLSSLIINLNEGKMIYTAGPPCSSKYESVLID